MKTVFRGRFTLRLDTKGRLSLPSSLRTALASSESHLVVTNSQHKGSACLDLYSLSEWEKLESRISKLPPLRTEVQAFQRFYLSGAQRADLDGQNRFLIPQSLRDYAGLANDVVLVGMGTKIEVWSEKAWNKLYQSLASSFEETLAAIATLTESESSTKAKRNVGDEE